METSSDLFDSEFPTGPWRTSGDALVEISAYAKHSYTGGGARGAQFQSRIEGKYPNLRRRIGCSCRGTPNCKEGSFDTSKTVHGANCRWGVSLALQNNEWILHSIRADHSHELLTDQAEILSAYHLVRQGIPEELKITCKMMRQGGAAARTIHQTLAFQ